MIERRLKPKKKKKKLVEIQPSSETVEQVQEVLKPKKKKKVQVEVVEHYEDKVEVIRIKGIRDNSTSRSKSKYN